MLAPAPALPANVRLCAECASEAVPDKLAGFAAGIIPFKVNRLTASVDPIKYYEYRSAGLPVISTRFGDMAGRGADQDVYPVGPDTDFRELLSRVRAHPASSCKALDRFRAEHAWQSRFERSRFFRAQVLGAAGN